MSPLAVEIYKQLRRILTGFARRRQPACSITYRELAEVVSRKHPTHQRSARFHAALTEVSVACRERALPCLPAIVWSATKHRPGDGYFRIAHPRARTDETRRAAWEREHAAVVREAARYPATP